MHEIRLPKLGVLYRGIYRYGLEEKAGNSDGELCYANNTRSLFRKYKHLVTEFANNQLGRDYLSIPNFRQRISLLTPQGYHLNLGEVKNEYEGYGIFYPRPEITEQFDCVTTCGSRGGGLTQAIQDVLGLQFNNERYFYGEDHAKRLC